MSDDLTLSELRAGIALQLREIEGLRAEVRDLKRWKSTMAPRIESLEGLLSFARAEAEAGREAIATLEGEREANALLTEENERLRTALTISTNGLRHCSRWNISNEKEKALMAVVMENETILKTHNAKVSGAGTASAGLPG